MRKAALTVEGFRHPSVKDEMLPEDVRGLPLGREALRAVMFKLPIIVSDPRIETDYTDAVASELNLEKSPLELMQPTKFHARSFIIDNPDFKQRWQDEYGNYYSAISTKGNNFSSPGLHKHATAAEGVIPYGLQESSIIERVLRASQLMRSKGISTEYIFGVSEPMQYPWVNTESDDEPSEILDLEEYKRRIVLDYWTKLPPEEQTIDALKTLTKQFEKMTFLVSFRATDSPYRLLDFASGKAREEIYRFANEHLLEDGMEPFLDNSDNEDDEYYRYINTISAPRLGINFARLHHAGLTHNFAHPGNLTVNGGIVDLDSIEGEPLGLGNDKVTEIDIAYELANITKSFTLLDGESGRNILQSMCAFFEKYIDETEALSSQEETRQHISRVLFSYMNYAEVAKEHKNPYAGHIMGFVFNIVARAYLEKYLAVDPDELQSLFEEFRKTKEDLFEQPTMLESSKERALLEIADMKDEIMDMAIGTIVDTYRKNQPFDIVRALQEEWDVFDGQLDRLAKALIDEYPQMLIEQFEEMHGDAIKAKCVGFEHSILPALYYDVLVRCEQELTDQAKSVLKSTIFPAIQDKVGELLDVSIPDNIFENHSSTVLHVSEKDSGNFWLDTEETPLETTMAVLNEEPVRKELLMTDLHHALVPLVKDAEVVQIVSDSITCGLEVIEQNGESFLEVGFDTITPTYLLVIEQNADGTRTITLHQK